MISRLEKHIIQKSFKEKELYFEMGYLLFKQNKFRKAIDFLSEAKQAEGTEPERWKIYFLLGEAYEYISKTKEAFDHFIEAAVLAGEQRKDCYAEVKELIRDYPSEDTEDWIKEKLKNDTPGSLKEEDRKELESLLNYCQSLKTKKGEESEFEVYKDGDKDVLPEIHELINAGNYKNALLKIDDGLVKTPYDTELLFSKIRALVEGQSDLKAASLLFSDPKYGYRKALPDNEINSKLDQLMIENPSRGNVFFFAAFLCNLMEMDIIQIRKCIEKAETLGLQNENYYPNIGLYLLKAEIAERNSERESAGKEYFEAAKCYYWQGNHNEASKYFEKTISLAPSLIEAYKYFADTLYILSYQNEPPYNNENLVKKAYKTWHGNPEKNVTQQKDAWFYLIIARIHEVKSKFSTVEYLEDMWLPVLYMERALIHDPNNFSMWAYLGRFYRNLQIEVNSMVAFEKAESLNPTDEFLKEEKTILQLNIGSFEEPITYLAALKEKASTDPTIYKTYHKSWDGYILFHYNKKSEALVLFEEVIKEINNDLFAHQMKMFCYWYKFDWPAAKKEAEEIIELGKKYTYLKEEFTFSWAYLISGQPGKAIQMVEGLISQCGNSRDNSYSLFQFYLFNDQIHEAEKIFDVFIKTEYNKRVLNDLSESLDALDFQFKSEKPELYLSAKIFQEKIKSSKVSIRDRIEYIKKSPLTPSEELVHHLKGAEYGESSVPTISVQVSLGRIQQGQKNMPEAYSIYHSLLKYDSLFSEVLQVLEQIENEIFSSARSFLKESRFKDAIQYLSRLDAQSSKNAHLYNALLSLAYFGSNLDPESLECMQDALKSTENNAELRKQVWTEIIEQAYIPKLSWDFGHFIKTNVVTSGTPEALALQSDMNKNFWEVLMNKVNVLYPVVTPIAIEMSDDLVPPEAYSDEWHVIKYLVPAMRERIDKKLGVKPPGVRIRGNDGGLTSGTYIISLDEVPLVMGTVIKDHLFVPDSEKELQTLSITGQPGMNPYTRKNGSWVKPEIKAKLIKNNIPFWDDHYDYIIAHLESVLVNSIDLYVDISFCDAYLESITSTLDSGKETNSSYENANRIRTEPALILVFNEVLKGLAIEKVPLHQKSLIIQSFLEAQKVSTEASDLIRYIRIALKNELPFNTVKLNHFELPVETEKNIRKELITQEGKTFLAMTPEVCQKTLLEIRNMVNKDPSPENLMLVTKDAQLRIHLRKLVELEFPNLIVASQEELIKA